MAHGDLDTQARERAFRLAGKLRYAVGERLVASPGPARNGQERNGWCPERMYSGRIREARADLEAGRPAAALAKLLPYVNTPLDEGLHYTVMGVDEPIEHAPGEAARMAAEAAAQLRTGDSE